MEHGVENSKEDEEDLFVGVDRNTEILKSVGQEITIFTVSTDI